MAKTRNPSRMPRKSAPISKRGNSFESGVRTVPLKSGSPR